MLRATVNGLLKKLEKSFAVHNRIEVSRSAILHNVDLFARLSGKGVIPVLKGNAYGHGIEQVASALKGRKLRYIAVDGYFEALRVRKVSRQPVLVMGAIRPENFAKLKYSGFAFAVQDAETIEALAATGKHIKVHIECNTGMNRYGARPDDAIELAKLILTKPNLQLEGIMSHLADSDGDDPTTVAAAVEQFDETVESIRALGAEPSIIHIAQTAGSAIAESKHANALRLGIGLYGINPFAASHRLHAKLKGLRPAMRFISTVTKVTDLKKGDKVSYNYTFTAPRDVRIGVLPVGYYEGLNRALSNAGTVKVGKHQAAIIGRVCMNHTMISLEGVSATVGDEVVVYSDDPRDPNSIDAIAAKHNLFNYNLLTALSADVRRVLVK
ncbi:MAG TPA: alanine racemase [Candidatus Saccharimonadales bacterium]|nr:alanine racemase [Candidatus Saccharimonadales bacterium]